jgi:hypothetical protein
MISDNTITINYRQSSKLYGSCSCAGLQDHALASRVLKVYNIEFQELYISTSGDHTDNQSYLWLVCLDFICETFVSISTRTPPDFCERKCDGGQLQSGVCKTRNAEILESDIHFRGRLHSHSISQGGDQILHLVFRQRWQYIYMTELCMRNYLLGDSC